MLTTTDTNKPRTHWIH